MTASSRQPKSRRNHDASSGPTPAPTPTASACARIATSSSAPAARRRRSPSLLARGFGRKRLLELNSRALDEQINLALTLQAADPATRNWVAANALRHSRMSTWERLMV
jgi:hypothetical protein